MCQLMRDTLLEALDIMVCTGDVHCLPYLWGESKKTTGTSMVSKYRGGGGETDPSVQIKSEIFTIALRRLKSFQFKI